MMRTVFFLVVLSLASGLWANEIAIAAPDGKSGWILLEEPYGAAGPGLSEHAGDPGMPVPDAHRWPHALKENGAGRLDGRYPQTELWHFAAGKYTRATQFLDHAPGTHRRTLIAVVAIGGKPYVLHLEKFKTQLVRVEEAAARAGGAVPADAVVLNPDAFLDAPEVSPDGKHIAFRAWTKAQPSLRVYSTETWKLVAESEHRTFGRPAWIDNSSLAVIAFEGSLPEAPQRDGAYRIHESHAPASGKLLRADLKDAGLALAELLAGSFPPDRYTRTVIADPKGLGLVVARAEGKEIIAEQREPKAGGKTREIGRYEAWRGCCIAGDEVRCAGVRTIERAKTFVITAATSEAIIDHPLSYASPEGHGGLIDMGNGVSGLIEPVTNPEFDPASKDVTQLLRHTLMVFNWPGCDSMRNPRVLAKLSKLVRSFTEVGEVKSTLLAFDIEIRANNGRNEKKGRYIELYSAAGRGGNGAIRIEDNLSGSWLVQSIEGGGDAATDDYYSWAGSAANPPKMDSKPGSQAGKAYDDLITQLEARKLLMLSGVDKDWQSGGLTFLGRSPFYDPHTGTTWRTWVFEKYGRVLDEEKYKATEAELKALQAEGKETREKLDEMKALRERIEIRFVADLPIGLRGDWHFPHAIAQVQMKFALSNQQKAAYTELTFEPGTFVRLPNLVMLGSDKGRGTELLLPKTFRIFSRSNQGKLVPELKATAVTGEKPFDHRAELVKSGKVQPGYNVPMPFGNRPFTEVQR